MPNYVAIGRSYGAGFLGVRHAPLVVNDASRGVENLKPMAGSGHFDDRLGLLQEMEQAFYRDYKSDASADHRTTYQRAVTLMQSKEAKAFDLSLEPASARAAYGSGRFGEGCLLARRLVEAGVSFVEVTLGGWDTHQNNFDRVKQLSQQVDPADHYPRAWSTVLAGGGIKSGQVIGKTDSEGATVVERSISAMDFLATICQLLGIDWKKQNNTPIGRPIRIVEKGANPIKELLG
jgi:hypothetical protein